MVYYYQVIRGKDRQISKEAELFVVFVLYLPQATRIPRTGDVLDCLNIDFITDTLLVHQQFTAL